MTDKYGFLARKIRSWLGITELFDGYTALEASVHRQRNTVTEVRKDFKHLLDKSYMGVDLGFKDDSQIVMLRYSPATNGWLVIADTKYKKGTYQQVIRNLRDIVRRHNCKDIAIDEANLESIASIADIKARLEINRPL